MCLREQAGRLALFQQGGCRLRWGSNPCGLRSHRGALGQNGTPIPCECTCLAKSCGDGFVDANDFDVRCDRHVTASLAGLASLEFRWWTFTTCFLVLHVCGSCEL